MENYLHGLLDEKQDPVIQEYLKYIDEGIPAPPKKKNILIVGAGMAGMVAAVMLKNVGHTVTIVEANTRVGGRIKTIRNTEKKKYFEDEFLYCEAGAMRIPSNHMMVLKYIKQLKLTLEPFYNVSVDKTQAIDYKNQTKGTCALEYWEQSISLPAISRNSLLFVNYKKVVQSDYYKSDENINHLLGYGLKEGITGTDTFENYNAKILLSKILDPLKLFLAQDPINNWPILIQRYGNYSMIRFLKEESLYSDNAIEMISVLQNLESRLAYDFIQTFIEANIIKDETTFWQIVGGSDRLPIAFFDAHHLSDNIYFNSCITKLWMNNNGKVKVTTKKERLQELLPKTDAVIDDQKPADDKIVDDMEFDEVIVTIPFSAFRHVHVWPAFSQGKRRAVRELHYDSATKILLEFKERWWEELPYNIVGGSSITDLSNRFVYYPSQDIGKKGHGLILASYVWSDEASRWDAMGDMDRYEYALQNVAVIHAPDNVVEQKRIINLAVLKKQTTVEEKKDKSNNADPGNIIGAATQSWMQDPYAFGEAAIFNPGQLHSLQAHIISTEWEGKAHFAGEHASLKHAWIEGAIESGIRAALEVNETPLKLNELLKKAPK